LEYNEITGFIRRRYIPALVVFLVILISTTVFSFIVPPTYMSDCMLTIVTGGQQQFLADVPIIRGLTSLSKTGTPLDTQIELVRITPRLRECIEQLDLRDKKGELLQPRGLYKKITVESFENTDIIQIRAYDHDPEIAQKIAQTLADNYLATETKKDKEYATAARSLMENEVQRVKADLDKVDEDLKNFINKWGAIDVETEARVQVEGLADLDKEYFMDRAQLAGLRNRRAIIEEQLKQQEAIIPSAVTLSNNPELLSLQSNLNSNEIRLAGLLTRYTNEHPEVVNTREQIAEIKKRMAELAEKIVTSEVTGPNLVYQQLTVEYVTESAWVDGLEAQIKTLEAVRDAKRREALKDIGEKDLEYITLTRQQKVLEEIYSTMQARFAEVLIREASSESAGRTVKNAEVPIRPSSPNKLLNVIGGFIIGIVLALVLALGLELVDKRLKGPEEIIGKFGLKDLGTLRHNPTEAQLNSVYGSMSSLLSLSGKGDRAVCVLCFGRPQVGLDALAALSRYPASLSPLTLVVFDNELVIAGEPAYRAGGDLVSGLRDGIIKAKKHPEGYDLLAAKDPYPIDFLLGNIFKRFIDALKKEGRAFLFAPVVTNESAAPMVCAACDATILMVELRRTSLPIIEEAINEINAANGNVVGFINLA